MDIGNILQEARIAKDLSLDTVAQETNIRKACLEAIEQNDYASLHGDVFVKGVMRTYGNYLGLNGAQLVEEYKSSILGTTQVKNNNSIRESHHVKVRPTFKSNRDIGSGNGYDHGFLFIIAGILAVALATGGGIYYYLTQTGQELNSLLPLRFGVVNETKEQNNNSVTSGKDNTGREKSVSLSKEADSISEMKTYETKAKEIKSDDKKKGDSRQLSVNVEDKNSPKNSSATTVSDKKAVSGNVANEIKVTSAGRCWLRVTDQKGTELFQGTLLQGESKSFSSNSNIIMRIGNLKDLQIEHNGNALPFEVANEPVTRIYTSKEVQ